MVAIPTGTVSFLFTDIEQSTRSWEDNTDAMERALARHDEIVRATVAESDGYVFASGGDGFAVAFHTASVATAAAVEIQRALASEPWPEGVALNVRMGVHTGDAQERDSNYFGPTVNRAARIMDAAHGRQILVSEATAASIDSAGLIDLGLHWLKDLPTRERLWHLVVDADESFPPPRTLGSGAATNLRPADEAPVGRDVDGQAVNDLLTENRLVSIIGVGGIGKTRLALDVANRQVSDHGDGVWWCELAPLGDEEAVAQAVATVIGARQHPGRSMIDSVAEFCRRREMLLVFDNCEHVLDAAGALVEAILGASPGSRVLVTSREGLGCRGERAYPIKSLDAGGTTSPAFELFVRRAAEVVPGREWDAEEAEAITRICRRLDGMPLAIELAAGRVRSLSPSEIETRLDDAFRVLRGGRRSLERHRTLEAAIDWSYELLDEASAIFFERLAVFAGGFDLEAAEAICAGDDAIDELDVAELLDELILKSLVVADHRPHRSTRYRLLEPLRQYAENRLAARGDALDLNDAHAAYYCRWAEAQERDRYRDEMAWRLALEAEFSNLRAAITWAVGARNADLALRTTVALDSAQAPFLMLEVGDWAISAVSLDEAVEHPLGPDACRTAAASAWWRADFETLHAMIARAESMSHYDRTKLHTNQIKAMALVAGGDYEAALETIDAIDASEPSTAVVPWWRTALLPETRASDVELLRRFEQETGSTILAIMADQGESSMRLRLGDIARAEECTRRAIERSRELGCDYYLHLSIPILASTATRSGGLTRRDLEDIRDGLRLQRDCGAKVDQWLLMLTALVALLQAGRAEDAEAIRAGLKTSPWKDTPLLQMVMNEFFADLDESKQAPALEQSEIVDRTLAALDELLAGN